MVQSLRLRVTGDITKGLMAEISRRINPDYLREQLTRKGVPNKKCPECKTTTFKLTQPYETIPTSDLTLKRDDKGFYGSASGAELSDKLIVKALALKGIQQVLKQHRLKSRMDFSDVADYEYARMVKYSIIRGGKRIIRGIIIY